MKVANFLGALVLACVATPYAALADDPLDPTMDAAAIARDRELIRLMNLDLLAQVTERDKRFKQGWRDHELSLSGTHPDQLAYQRRLAEYESKQARYAQDRGNYEQAMSDWRRDVAACRGGHYESCAAF
ncbi:MAG: hypothetical protein P8J20_07485 [Novosphingobium sp.]|nr:hypothetical protein [Novosphingobium sp.]